jgi:hypothetical protein
MTKDEALQVLKLLIALESWDYSHPNLLPDYLIEDTATAMDVLTRIILEKNT